ncbi:MAG: hypothetical protein ACFCVF_03995 [Kineosporiaceae bacterium]
MTGAADGDMDGGVDGGVDGPGWTGNPSGDGLTGRVWPGAGEVHRLVHRAVGPVDPTAPVQRLWAQLQTAVSSADDTAIDLARRERTALVVSAAVYGGVATAVVGERAEVTPAWVDHAVRAAVGAGPGNPGFARRTSEARPGLEILDAAGLLAGSVDTLRFVTARAEAARAVRDRLVVLLSGRGASPPELVARTGLSRATVDRILTTVTGPGGTPPGGTPLDGPGPDGTGAGGSGALGSGGGGSGGS